MYKVKFRLAQLEPHVIIIRPSDRNIAPFLSYSLPLYPAHPPTTSNEGEAVKDCTFEFWKQKMRTPPKLESNNTVAEFMNLEKE